MRGKIEGVDRVKTSELLAKSNGDFIEKIIFPGKDGEPQDISGLSDLDAAVRINQLIAEAMKRKKVNTK